MHLGLRRRLPARGAGGARPRLRVPAAVPPAPPVAAGLGAAVVLQRGALRPVARPGDILAAPLAASPPACGIRCPLALPQGQVTHALALALEGHVQAKAVRNRRQRRPRADCLVRAAAAAAAPPRPPWGLRGLGVGPRRRQPLLHEHRRKHQPPGE
eukprot:1184571-Prorocentrum_minimum.AAC.1